MWEGGHVAPMHEIWHIWDGEGQIREEGGKWTDLDPGLLVWLKQGRFYETRQNPDNPSGITHFIFKIVDERSANASNDCAATVPLCVEGVSPNFCDIFTRRILDLHWEIYIEAITNPDSLEAEQIPKVIFWDDQNAFRRSQQCPLYTRMHCPSNNYTVQAQMAGVLFRGLIYEYLRHGEQGIRAEDAGVSKRHFKVINNLACNIRSDIRNVPPVEDMARNCGYSFDYFCRIFQSYMHMSPKEYVIHIRVMHAKELLTSSDMSMKEIAEWVGYQSASFFTRQFREKTSLSPKEYRNKHRLQK